MKKIAALSLLFGAVSYSALALPTWVSSLEADNQQLIFGVASGSTVEQAKRNALLDIAGKFNHQVEEQLSQLVSQQDGQNRQAFKLETHTKIKPVDLSHYQFDQIEQEGDLIWARAALERAPFAQQQKLRWQTKDAQLRPLLEPYAAEQWSLKETVYYPNVVAAMQLQWSIIQQLSVLDSPLPASEIKRYMAYQNHLANSERLAVVQLYTQAADEVLALVKETLSAQQLRSTEVAKRPQSGISLEQQFNCAQDSREAYLCELHLNVVSLEQGQVLGQANYFAKGRDYRSEQNARQKALTSLKLNWQRLSLSQWLNIDTPSNL